MAKREISSTLKNLKFMQRAAQKEEKSKEVEEVIVPNGSFSPSGIVKKCVVVMDGDPHPGINRGRMSFQSFNPSIDKLNGEVNTPSQPEASAQRFVNPNGRFSFREEESTQDDNMESKMSTNSTGGDLKRKQPEVVSETPSPNDRFKRIFQSGQEANKSNKKSNKQSKGQKLNWSVLRPPKKPKED